MWKTSRPLGSQTAVVNKEGFLMEKAFEFSSQGQEIAQWQEGDGFWREGSDWDRDRGSVTAEHGVASKI